MKASVNSGRGSPVIPGLAVLAGGGFFIGAFLLLDFLPVPHGKGESRTGPAGVSVVSFQSSIPGDAGPDMTDQFALLDPEPLFLPTRWNFASRGAAPAGRKLPTEIFDPFPPQWLFDEARLTLSEVEVAVPPESAEAVSGTWDRPFDGFGRSDVPPVRLAGRQALLVVRPIEKVEEDGVPVIAEQLDFHEGVNAGGAWQPVEFMLYRQSFATLVSLSILSGSGQEAIDQWLRSLPRIRPDLFYRLPDGVYSGQLGP